VLARLGRLQRELRENSRRRQRGKLLRAITVCWTRTGEPRSNRGVPRLPRSFQVFAARPASGLEHHIAHAPAD